ncbi:MAG: hypothetical protein IKD10_08565 [Lentisphaeria bacterium]|nr:hypothetical protein [Lentisphaeria bacterium]
MEKVYAWIDKFIVNLPAVNEFERGFYLALLLTALVFFLLLLLCLILKLIFRKPAVPGVTLEREDGDIFISRNAIFTAVCRLESAFPELEILKVNMLRKRHGELALTVTVMFDERDKSFDAVAGAFKQQVFAMLNKSFGIDAIKSVAINLAKIPAGNEDDSEGNTPEMPVVNNAFISGV